MRFMEYVTHIILPIIFFSENNLIEFDDFVLLMDIIKRDATRKEDQMKTLERAFKIFDKNGDGFIEVGELSRVMTELGEKLSEEEVKQMLAVADVDKDGKINYKGMDLLIKYIQLHIQ